MNAIGLWSLRIVLAVGMIVGGLLKNSDVSGSCAVLLLVSFFFFSAEGEE